MRFIRFVVLILSFCFGLYSCMLTNNVRTIQIETLTPAILPVPENVKSIAIIKDNLLSFERESIDFQTLIDSTINSNELENKCVGELTSFLKKEGNFQEILNYSDSMNFSTEIREAKDKVKVLFERTKADACIFLNFLDFENEIQYFYDGTYRTRVAISWTILSNNNAPPVFYSTIDTLFFSKSQYYEIRRNGPGKNQIYSDASGYMGKLFGTKLIPSWTLTERIFYHSGNPEMQKAERLALKQDWHRAAEIWNVQTKNKNKRIADKAIFNLALACEMEEKPDIALEWLMKLNSADTYFYQKTLRERKSEMEKLKGQLR